MLDYQATSYSFAQEFTRVKTSLFATRGQVDIAKIERDIFFGKLAEFAAYKWLCQFPEYTPDQPPVDHVLPRASWDPDLSNSKYNFAVKSCMENNPYGYAWTFDPKDPIIKYKAERYKVIFIVVEDEHNFLIHSTSDSYTLNRYLLYRWNPEEDAKHLEGKKLFVKAKNGHLKYVGDRVTI